LLIYNTEITTTGMWSYKGHLETIQGFKPVLHAYLTRMALKAQAQ